MLLLIVQNIQDNQFNNLDHFHTSPSSQVATVYHSDNGTQ